MLWAQAGAPYRPVPQSPMKATRKVFLMTSGRSERGGHHARGVRGAVAPAGGDAAAQAAPDGAMTDHGTGHGAFSCVPGEKPRSARRLRRGIRLLIRARAGSGRLQVLVALFLKGA